MTPEERAKTAEGTRARLIVASFESYRSAHGDSDENTLRLMDNIAVFVAEEREAHRRILTVLWQEFHDSDDHEIDGFGDEKEDCNECGCLRYKAHLVDGQPFVGYTEFANRPRTP